MNFEEFKKDFMNKIIDEAVKKCLDEFKKYKSSRKYIEAEYSRNPTPENTEKLIQCYKKEFQGSHSKMSEFKNAIHSPQIDYELIKEKYALAEYIPLNTVSEWLSFLKATKEVNDGDLAVYDTTNENDCCSVMHINIDSLIKILEHSSD